MTYERRKYPRLGIHGTVSYSSGNMKGAGTSTDVSGVGIRFIAEHRLPIGAALSMVITLPDRPTPISCLGEVVWLARPSAPQPKEVGINFVTIDPADRAALVRYGLKPHA